MIYERKEMKMNIRMYRETDCNEIAKLFYETVHHVNAKDYSKKQRKAWATGTVDLSRWNQSFMKNYTVVAIQEEKITGFGDIDVTGYLDHLFVHKDFQGQGIATALCEELEKFAKEQKVNMITTHASLTARPFFERRGYQVVKEQVVFRQGIGLTNFIMEKQVEMQL